MKKEKYTSEQISMVINRINELYVKPEVFHNILAFWRVIKTDLDDYEGMARVSQARLETLDSEIMRLNTTEDIDLEIEKIKFKKEKTMEYIDNFQTLLITLTKYEKINGVIFRPDSFHSLDEFNKNIETTQKKLKAHEQKYSLKDRLSNTTIRRDYNEDKDRIENALKNTIKLKDGILKILSNDRKYATSITRLENTTKELMEFPRFGNVQKNIQEECDRKFPIPQRYRP